MLRTTCLAAMAAALIIPAARGQDLPSGSLGGQTNPVTGGQAGAGTQTGTGTRAGGASGTQAGAGAGGQTGTRGQAGTATGAGRQTGAGGQDTAKRSGVSDQLFMTAAASAGAAEMNLSQLGLKQATDPDLKAFSQRMVDEHTKANQELKAVAGQKGVTMPTALDARAAFCSQSLAGLTGEEFDRCYAKAQLLAHMDAVSMYEAEAERGMDNETKAFAARTLPHLKDHLKQIRPIAMKYMSDKDDDSAEHRTGSDRDRHRTEPGSSTGTGTPGGASGSGTSDGTTGGSTPRNSTGSGTPGGSGGATPKSE